MKGSKFKKPESNPLLNPVDWFNFYGSFISIFQGVKNCHVKSETEVCLLDPKELNPDYASAPTFLLRAGLVECLRNNDFDVAVGAKISKFMLLSAVKFKADYMAAMAYVYLDLMKCDIPYIRVGGDYFKIINKKDRWGGTNKLIRHWKKDEIKEDHTKEIIKRIQRFDDFDIIPNNKEYIPTQDGCYNLYAKFPHEEHHGEVVVKDIPYSLGIMKHIFGEQLDLGLKYMKLLYEHPTQILPILSLVSTERGTGKTTFLNWLHMIFGENTVLISPQDLTSSFNSIYATKNIIMVDETVVEKSATVEKLKSIATAKSITVSQKFVSEYSIPFFGKIILCTNKEKDFMKIDEEEVRFWVRKIRPVEKLNTNIENDLFNEIPKFLKFLSELPAIDFSRSRMVFTMDEIKTTELQVIKEESKSSLHKELELLLEDFFNNHSEINEFEATATDIKDRWFKNNNQISHNYVHKVVKNELKLPENKLKKYVPFAENDLYSTKKTGKPFVFLRKNIEIIQTEESENCPF